MKGGKYQAYNPVSNGKGDSVKFAAPKSLKSDYHTHGDYSKPDASGAPVRTSKANDGYDSDHFLKGSGADTGIAAFHAARRVERDHAPSQILAKRAAEFQEGSRQLGGRALASWQPHWAGTGAMPSRPAAGVPRPEPLLSFPGCPRASRGDSGCSTRQRRHNGRAYLSTARPSPKPRSLRSPQTCRIASSARPDLQRSKMINERELWACACLLLRRHGERTRCAVRRRADELPAQGEMEGRRTFMRLLDCIDAHLDRRSPLHRVRRGNCVTATQRDGFRRSSIPQGGNPYPQPERSGATPYTKCSSCPCD
jgi:hypothetical protein